jgi:hypothetical protein
LLGIFDGGDPFADFFEIGHDRLPALRGSKEPSTRLFASIWRISKVPFSWFRGCAL